MFQLFLNLFNFVDFFGELFGIFFHVTLASVLVLSPYQKDTQKGHLVKRHKVVSRSHDISNSSSTSIKLNNLDLVPTIFPLDC